MSSQKESNQIKSKQTAAAAYSEPRNMSTPPVAVLPPPPLQFSVGKKEKKEEDTTIEKEIFAGKSFSSSLSSPPPPPEIPPFSLGKGEATLQKKAAQFSRSNIQPFQLKSGSSSSSSSSLPEDVRGKMENAFKADFSNVNIHTDSQSATNVGALAYAQGNDVHFAPGQFKPDTQAGQELIGHELTHVVQQRQGRVQATKQAKGMPVNDNPGLEREADDMGQKAAKSKPIIQRQQATSSMLPHVGNQTGSFRGQTIGGTLIAGMNLLGFETEKLGDIFPPTHPLRQELDEIITPYLDDSLGMEAGKMARMIKGQNGAQTAMRQPVGPMAVQAFKKQLEILSGIDGLPEKEQQDIISTTHVSLMRAFSEDSFNYPSGGYASGAFLHGVGALEAQIGLGDYLGHGNSGSPIQQKLSGPRLIQAQGLAINDDVGLEREADDMGRKAAREEIVDKQETNIANGSGIVQQKEATNGTSEQILQRKEEQANTILKDTPTKEYENITKLNYEIKKGDNLEKVINKNYTDFGYTTGRDRRHIAHAIAIINDGSTSISFGEYNRSWKGWIKDNISDTEMAETRKIYNTIRLKAGGTIKLPIDSYVDMLQQQGQVGSRSDEKNFAVATAKSIAGFQSGISAGFLSAGVGAVSDLWDLVVSIFTGEIVKQAYQIYKQITSMSWQEFGEMLSAVFGGVVDNVKAIWNNPNPEQKWTSIGKFVGMILFEVALAILTAGIGTAIKNSAKVAKLLNKIPSLKKITNNNRAGLDNLDATEKKRILDSFNSSTETDIVKSPDTPNGVTSANKTTEDLTPANRTTEGELRGNESPKLLPENAANWLDVKGLINKNINDVIDLPNGYIKYKNNGQTLIRRKVADDKKFAKLTVDKDGRIQTGSATSNRISKNGKLSRILETPKGHQAHHVIPDQVVRDHDLFKAARKDGKPPYEIDSKSNGISLPETDGDRIKGLSDNLPLHKGSHGHYNQKAKLEADDILNDLLEEYGSIDKIPPNILTQAAQAVENTMREIILSKKGGNINDIM